MAKILVTILHSDGWLTTIHTTQAVLWRVCDDYSKHSFPILYKQHVKIQFFNRCWSVTLLFHFENVSNNLNWIQNITMYHFLPTINRFYCLKNILALWQGTSISCNITISINCLLRLSRKNVINTSNQSDLYNEISKGY